jgi:hypothetical protein
MGMSDEILPKANTSMPHGTAAEFHKINWRKWATVN